MGLILCWRASISHAPVVWPKNQKYMCILPFWRHSSKQHGLDFETSININILFFSLVFPISFYLHLEQRLSHIKSPCWGILCQKHEPPDYLFIKISRAYIQESQMAVGNRAPIVKGTHKITFYETQCKSRSLKEALVKPISWSWKVSHRVRRQMELSLGTWTLETDLWAHSNGKTLTLKAQFGNPPLLLLRSWTQLHSPSTTLPPDHTDFISKYHSKYHIKILK